MNHLTRISAVLLLVILASCSSKKEQPSDAGMDVHTTPDAAGDSDTDSDTDSDADSDGGQSCNPEEKWCPLPDEGEYCGEHCRQVTFVPEVRTEYDLNQGYLVYSDNDSNIRIIDLEQMKHRMVYKSELPIHSSSIPTVNNSWIYYKTVPAEPDISILKRRNLISWKEDEIKTYHFKREPTPHSLLARGDYVCMYMSSVMNSSNPGYINCFNPDTQDEKELRDVRIEEGLIYWIYNALFHNGREIVYSYDIPTATPYGSGTHIMVRNISDGGVLKTWEYLGDKGDPQISAKGAVWIDLRNDEVDNKNGNASYINSDIYYLDLNTLKEQPICTDSAVQWYPATDGNLVAWKDQRNSPEPTQNSNQDNDIYIYDMDKEVETNLTEGVPGCKKNIRLSGKWLSFEMMAPEGYNFFAIDLEARGLYSE